MKTLVWFRTDLRTHDNTALSEACAASDKGVVGLFIVSPDEWRRHDWAPVKVDLVLRTATELSRRLESLNIALRIVTAESAADIPALVADLAARESCDAVYFNREYEINEARRDEKTESECAARGVRCRGFHDQVFAAPGEVRTGEGRYFTVFTPFKKALYNRMLREGLPAAAPSPKKQPRMTGSPDPVPATVRGFESGIVASLWPAGETHARKMLKTFVQRRITDYKSQRDMPAIEGTSMLSPYLNIGAVSCRECLLAAAEANSGAKGSPLDSGSEGIAHWISELVWREFYIHIMVGYPRVCMHRAFQPATERIRWSDNEAHFKAWCEGRTGVPIVDAAMRQLLSTGWMHNRLRMIAAMYLTKNLFIDWRKGEKFFMRHLVDGFLASNNGGWQWSASTGTDAAPYFRIFNPVSQSRKFDPDGEFLRRMLPELRGVEGGDIHEPWLLPGLLRTRLNYPDPLVDLSRSRQKAIEAFQKIKGAPVTTRAFDDV